MITDEQLKAFSEELAGQYVEGYFKETPPEELIKNFLKEKLEKKTLRKEYDRMYEAISSMNLHQIKSIRKLVIKVLADSYFTTEEKIRSILNQTKSTIPKNNYQHSSSKPLYL